MESHSEQNDPLTYEIIRCGISVHSQLGPGLLERPYQYFFAYELKKAGLSIAQQKSFSIKYDGHSFDLGFRGDIVVENQVIIEIKTVTALLPIHTAQVLTYLRLSGIERGLLMNFHAQPLTSGIKRLVLSKPR